MRLAARPRSTALNSALQPPQSVWGEPAQEAAVDLDRNGLASVPLITMMGADGILAPRTSAKGIRCLAFVNESDHVAANAPTM